MPFKLEVTPTATDGDATTYDFATETVVIGRDVSADLALDDTARIVSNRHAEVRQAGEALTLADLGSKNGTIFNGRRLRSGETVTLREGDVFELGDFAVRVKEIQEEQRVAPESSTLPARGEIESGLVGADEVNEIGPTPDGKSAVAEDEPEELEPEKEHKVHAGDTDSRDDFLPLNDPARPPTSDTNEVLAASKEAGEPDKEMLDALVAAIALLAGIPWQFRHEFIGQTIAPPDDVAVFADGKPDALARFLLDPRLDASERDERRAALEAATESGALHQVAMLDGYKAGIQEGTRHLLEALDPDVALTAAKEGSFLGRLPLFRETAAFKKLRQTYADIAQEDEAVAERGRFRPAFIRAYLARMTRRSGVPD